MLSRFVLLQPKRSIVITFSFCTCPLRRLQAFGRAERLRPHGMRARPLLLRASGAGLLWYGLAEWKDPDISADQAISRYMDDWRAGSWTEIEKDRFCNISVIFSEGQKDP